MSDQVHNLNYLKQVRRDLRKNSTPQEIILWQQLRKQNLGYVFKRQESMGNFIIDFYCPAKKLAIEVDGSQHLDNKEAD